jgi:formate hydrogenlyase subunit 3/multisubunit Na+/H+ antiporter MnhD subunit
MIQFYFFWQGMLLVSTFLVAHGARSRRTGLLFFGVTQGGAALLLFALVAMASAARDWNIYAQGPLLVAQHPLWMAAMIVLLLVGFGTALGAAPFHRWLIRLGGGASPAVMILMTALMGTGAAYGLLRFVFSAFPYWGAMPLTSPVIVVAAAGQVYGAIRALRDTDPQRSVAWVAVSLAGFLLMAAATGFSGTEERGLAGAIVDLPQHAAAVILLLAGLGLKAAGRGRPGPAGQVAFICAFLALLGLAPIGPFAGNYLANGSALRLGGVFAVAAIVSWLAIALLAAYVWRAASAGTRPSIDISRPAFLRVVVAAVVVIVGALTAWSSSWMPFVERVALNLALRR